MLMRRSTGIGSSLPVSFSPLLSLHNLLAVGAESVKLPGPSEHGLNDRVRSQPRGDVELQDAPRFRPRSTELQRALRRILLFPAVVTDGRHLPPDLLQVLTEDPVSGEHLCRPEGERNPALILPSLPIGEHGADGSVWPPGVLLHQLGAPPFPDLLLCLFPDVRGREAVRRQRRCRRRCPQVFIHMTELTGPQLKRGDAASTVADS
jgi:hypothetical protein